MKRFIGIIPIIIILFSCKSHPNQAVEENKISLLLYRDSVMFYSGILNKKTVYKKYAYTDTQRISDVIEANRLNYGFQSEINVKLALKNNEDFNNLYIYRQNMQDVMMQNTGPDFRLIDISEKESQLFSLLPFRWSILDSLARPKEMDLVMPKDEDDIKIPQDKNSITCIVFASDNIYCYSGLNLSEGKRYSSKGENTFGSFIAKKKKRLKNKVNVLLKYDEKGSYEDFINLFIEMGKTMSMNYSIEELTDEEKTFIHDNVVSLGLPKQEEITTSPFQVIQKIPDVNVMLIDIKHNKSVWCKTFTENGEEQVTKIIEPVIENLKNAITKYEKSHAKADKNTSF